MIQIPREEPDWTVWVTCRPLSWGGCACLLKVPPGPQQQGGRVPQWKPEDLVSEKGTVPTEKTHSLCPSSPASLPVQRRPPPSFTLPPLHSRWCCDPLLEGLALLKVERTCIIFPSNPPPSPMSTSRFCFSCLRASEPQRCWRLGLDNPLL